MTPGLIRVRLVRSSSAAQVFKATDSTFTGVDVEIDDGEGHTWSGVASVRIGGKGQNLGVNDIKPDLKTWIDGDALRRVISQCANSGENRLTNASYDQAGPQWAPVTPLTLGASPA